MTGGPLGARLGEAVPGAPMVRFCGALSPPKPDDLGSPNLLPGGPTLDVGRGDDGADSAAGAAAAGAAFLATGFFAPRTFFADAGHPHLPLVGLPLVGRQGR